MKIANSSGREVVAHAASAEGMRRAALAGVKTIEHGDGGTPEVFEIMRQRNVSLCPTIAAGEAISTYRGWAKGTKPYPTRIIQKKKSFQDALNSGIKIVAGGDVGVFPHGDNVRELELMVEYGMQPIDVLRASTSGNAEIVGMDKTIGQIAEGYIADLIAVTGNPVNRISDLRKIQFVMKDGKIYKQE